MLIGIKQGINLARINYQQSIHQDVVKFDYNKGYSGGLVFQYFSEKKLGLQVELLYSHKGFITQYDTVNDNQYQRDIKYISFPLLTHFYLLQKNTSPFLLLGGFGSIAVSSREKFIDHHTVTLIQDYTYNRKHDNRGEFGLVAGFGIKRIFPFGTLQAQAEYSFSFSSLYKWGTVSDNTSLDNYFKIPEVAQNQVITISVSYLLTIKKKTFN